MSIILLLLLTQTLFPGTYPPERTITIMLDPAGDARTPGRTIDDSFERGITLEFCQALKGSLEELIPGARMVLTRVPGETIAPLQNANFSNRLNANLFVSIHCYQERESRSTITTYYYLQHPITDLWHKPRSLAFYPYDQAHMIHVHTSASYAQCAQKWLNTHKAISAQGPWGIPFKPLVGIVAPAVAFEIGIHHKAGWSSLVTAIAQALTRCINPSYV